MTHCVIPFEHLLSVINKLLIWKASFESKQVLPNELSDLQISRHRSITRFLFSSSDVYMFIRQVKILILAVTYI